MNLDKLFEPFSFKSLKLKNRFVMAPMTRSLSPGGIPTDAAVEYYGKRAQGEVGLILSEGTVIQRKASSNDPNVPHFYGKTALNKWERIIHKVHTYNGCMGPQLWHMGIMPDHNSGWLPDAPFEGPSGYKSAEIFNGNTMSDADIADTITAFGNAAAQAKQLGFDCIELHGAHDYLIDQFFWSVTNRRKDKYGGDSLTERSRFAVEIIKEVRKRVGNEFALIIRLSQWKTSDYNNKLAKTPQEMEGWLNALSEAGIDIFHCSQRRFWEAEFDESDLNFAGWAKKLTGKATITVGSVGLNKEFTSKARGDGAEPSSLQELMRRLDRGDFDLVAVGRVLISDPNWVQKIRNKEFNQLIGFSKDSLKQLL